MTDPVPLGTYLARVIEVREGSAQSKKGDCESYPFRILLWRIMRGPQSGGVVNEFLSFDKKEHLHSFVLQRRAETLRTLRVDPSKPIDWQSLVGKHAQITVNAWKSNKTGETKISVSRVFPAQEGDEAPGEPPREEIDLDALPF